MRAPVTPVLGLVVALAAVSGACGGGSGLVASPTPAAPPSVVGAAAATTGALPAGLDRAYVLTLSSATPDGRPKVWAGGPFHHCVGGGIDLEALQPVLDEMSALTGIPQTTAGACNVEWTWDASPGHSSTVAHGSDVTIVYALVTLHEDSPRAMRHEAGHVLGLAHSPRPEDLMYASARAESFSRLELAVIAWMYGR